MTFSFWWWDIRKRPSWWDPETRYRNKQRGFYIFTEIWKQDRTETMWAGMKIEWGQRFVMSGTEFTLKLKSCPVHVSWMRAKDRRLLGQNKLLYYSQHIKCHEYHVSVSISCPPNSTGVICLCVCVCANRYYTHSRFALYPRHSE